LLFWGFIGVGIAMLLVYASLAEMASMYAIVLPHTPPVFHPLTNLGRPQLADNITGCVPDVDAMQSAKHV